MSDDSLRETWMSGQPMDRESLMTAVNAVLEENRAARGRQRWTNRLSMLVIVALCPVLVWCAAFGTTPLVRGGYGLMAVGTAAMIVAEWLYSTWSWQALPGPVNTRSQLQKTGFLLSRQAHLLRTAPLWCAPIFIGPALIGMWVYGERSHAAAYFLWAFAGSAWFLSWLTGRTRGAMLRDRRARLDRVLNDLG